MSQPQAHLLNGCHRGRLSSRTACRNMQDLSTCVGVQVIDPRFPKQSLATASTASYARGWKDGGEKLACRWGCGSCRCTTFETVSPCFMHALCIGHAARQPSTHANMSGADCNFRWLPFCPVLFPERARHCLVVHTHLLCRTWRCYTSPPWLALGDQTYATPPRK